MEEKTSLDESKAALDGRSLLQETSPRRRSAQSPQSMEVEYTYRLDETELERRSWWFPWIPRVLRFDHAPLEATGCAVDMYARATVFMSAIFLGPALLKLASHQACAEDETDCSTARVYGFKPSSLLSNIAVLAGFLSTIILPLFGAVVDHTPHRRSVGAYSALGMVFIKFVELSIGPSTWLLIATLQVLSGVLFQMHAVAVYAYSSELTQTPQLQSSYQNHFFVCMYASMLSYVVQVLVVGNNADEVITARWAVGLTCLWCIPLFGFAWTLLFRDTPPMAQVPPGQTLFSVGFTRLWRTFRQQILVELPAVRVFLFGIMFSEAADSALPTIATTYMSDFLGMSSLEIGASILVVLLAGIPGTWLGHFVCERYNPVTSAQTSLVLYSLTTAAASCWLTEPRKHLIYLFGALWGICQGWMHPQHTTIFVAMIPTHRSLLQAQLHQQDLNSNFGSMEWMGVFLFVSQVLVFLPPLVFTVLNEIGLSMNWGLASLVLYFVLGLGGLAGMKQDYQAKMQATTLAMEHQ